MPTDKNCSSTHHDPPPPAHLAVYNNKLTWSFHKIKLTNYKAKSVLSRFQDWIPNVNVGQITSGDVRTIFLIKCAYEMQDVDVMESFTSFTCGGHGKILEKFKVFQYNITPVDCAALFQFISSMKNLYKLVFYKCTMDHLAKRELTKLLIRNNKITELSLKHDVSYEVAKYLSDALKSDNCKLTNLDISYNDIANEGVKYLSDALKSDNCKLTNLNISSNRFGGEGAKYLSDALKSDNCKLTNLDISYNAIANEGVKYLSDVLKSDNCKLTNLDIICNHFGSEGAKFLSDALKSDNCKLTNLNISSNRF